jgi:hypothetical protein
MKLVPLWQLIPVASFAFAMVVLWHGLTFLWVSERFDSDLSMNAFARVMRNSRGSRSSVARKMDASPVLRTTALCFIKGPPRRGDAAGDNRSEQAQPAHRSRVRAPDERVDQAPRAPQFSDCRRESVLCTGWARAGDGVRTQAPRMFGFWFLTGLKQERRGCSQTQRD